MLQPLLMAEAFGVERYPKIFSYANAASTVGVASGPVLMGYVFDASSYLVSFSAASAVSALSFVSSSRPACCRAVHLRRKARTRRGESAGERFMNTVSFLRRRSR